ncbi:nagb/rpia/CoA transferase-like protein [Setomelanomma holmii]|uniref:Nagb/rpia/CoA transferase-like protein n=1 Tax=Setomelanomma holmii TaxID=210430 RepID=A0A9P4HM18_9PLEO|nr:nagb/rpia/CoA transferase-like protein [Setomelanomma holmii]
MQDAASLASNNKEFWMLLVYAARCVSDARPSLRAAVASCLLRTLERVQGDQKRWTRAGWTDFTASKTEYTVSASKVIETIREERQTTISCLSDHFTNYVGDYMDVKRNGRTDFRILTLSNSSSIRLAVISLLKKHPDITIQLLILESRPRCEGADMAAFIHEHTDVYKGRISIMLMPDCALATATKDVDFVLLGADRISHEGNVSNKLGSLAAAMCAKQQNRNVEVVVINDIDKIAGTSATEEELEVHPSSELSRA